MLDYVKVSVIKQRMISQAMPRSQSQVFIAWDDEQNNYQLTYNKQLFKNSRLASLEEVLKDAHYLNSFIEVKHNRVLILSNGLFWVRWEEKNDYFGAEQYLYLVDIFNEESKHLVAIIPVF